MFDLGFDFVFFFFNDTATTEIYTLSLHDALPICARASAERRNHGRHEQLQTCAAQDRRSEEHTSELQSQSNLVCRLLLEKKKNHQSQHHYEHINTWHVVADTHPEDEHEVCTEDDG